MSERKQISKYKLRQNVRDVWYGPGIVVKKTKKRLHIKLLLVGQTWKYDNEHVKNFITDDGEV